MAYHPLTSDTGGFADDRRAEADRILDILRVICDDDYTPKEAAFIEDMARGGTVSPKQLFWLRDIKDKYL